MKKAAAVGYYLLLVMGILLVFIASMSKGAEEYVKYEKNPGTEIQAQEERELSEDTREFVINPDSLEGNSCLLFFTNHQCVRAYADGTLIYAVLENTTPIGKTPGAHWNFINIPQGTKDIRIQVEAVYPQVRGENVVFLTGDGQAMYHNLVKASVPETVISIVDILIGLFMFAYWLVSKKRNQEKQPTLYFSVFATLLGLWSLNETMLVRLTMENRAASAFSAYIFLMLMMIPYMQFIEAFLEVGKKIVLNIFCTIYSAAIFVLAVLHFMGIYEFKQTLFVVHIMLVVEFMYSIGLVLIRVRQRGVDLKVKISIVGNFGFFCAFIADIFAYYVGMQNTDLLGRIALLAYILMLGYEVMVESAKDVEEWQKAEVYRELAMKDTLTGLYNRNAYNQWLEEHNKDQDVAILMCDLNDLKKCNDTRGHAVGDSYIMGAADIISRVFGKDGICYRIGGDEFCVIVNNSSKMDITQKIHELNETEEECNRMLAEIKIHIACGYAVFDKEQDQNIEDTCKRADQEMYRNKKERKLLAV